MREKLSRRQIIKEKKAASPAISMVIITAATVLLVLVAGNFATTVLDRQQAATEFNALQKSVLALDDAVRDVAWKEGASRSVRFTTSRGSFQPISTTKSVEIEFDGAFIPIEDPIQTSVIKYFMSDSYITLEKAPYYFLGTPNPAVSSISDSIAQASLTHTSGFVSISLGYRVRVSNEGRYQFGDNPTDYVNYVNIMIIELSCADFAGVTGDFNMIVRNMGVATTYYPYSYSSAGEHNINVYVDGVKPDFPVPIQLDSGQIILNLVVSKVSVSVSA